MRVVTCPACAGAAIRTTDRSLSGATVLLTYECECGHAWITGYRAPSGTMARAAMAALTVEPRLRLVEPE